MPLPTGPGADRTRSVFINCPFDPDYKPLMRMVRPRYHDIVMKLEDFSNLYFVVSVLVPGFIYSGVVANFIP
jgi:hypothetical protein